MTDKALARTTGALFLVSMTVSIIYTSTFAASLEEPLASISANRTRMVTGAIFELINCIAVVGIAITLHMILKRYNALPGTGVRCPASDRKRDPDRRCRGGPAADRIE